MKDKLLTYMAKSHLKTFTTSQILERLRDNSLDTNPPYQRDAAWNTEYQEVLVGTLIEGGRLISSPIFIEVVNEDGEVVGYICNDGKQRITSIDNFVLGKISARLSDGTTITYAKLSEKSADAQTKASNRRFKEANWSVNIMPPMPIEDQRDLFELINRSESLSTNEKIFCPNFHAKALSHQLLKVFKKEIVAVEKAKMTRFRDLRFVANVLHKVYGYRMDSLTDVRTTDRSITTKDITKFAKEIHKCAVDNHHKDGTLFDDTIMKKMGIDKAYACVVSVVKALGKVYRRIPYSKKWELSCIRDSLMMFTYLNATNRLTTSQIDEHRPVIFDILNEYQRAMAPDLRELGCQDSQTLSKRQGRLWDIIVQKCGANNIDLEPKRKNLTSEESMMAMINAGNECVMCGSVLTDDNCQIDHLDPKSKSSIHIPVVICTDCNLRKGNWSASEYQNYSDYVMNQKQANEPATA